MAVTVSIVQRRKMMNAYAVIADVTFDSSYPTGGESIAPSEFGLQVLDFVLASPASGYIFEFDHDDSKLKAYTPTTAHTHGENDAAGNTDANTAAAASEVANTTDMDEVTVRVLAIGY